MKIQIYSDLHLEFSKSFPKIKPLSKYLFLSSDISHIHIHNQNFKDFIQYYSIYLKTGVIIKQILILMDYLIFNFIKVSFFS